MLGGLGRKLASHLGNRLGHAQSTRLVPRPAYQFQQIRMVEGHGCHRVAHQHRKKMIGLKFKATSPNQRFAEGAAAINGKPLARIEVHGKNLFYIFGDEKRARGGNDAAVVVLHVHFGMAGRFSAIVGQPVPEERATTRLALVNESADLVAHLSAMTTLFGGLDYYHTAAAKLGEDPLREDANPEAAWEKVRVSKKPIGLILMDQTMIAGVGNIYRAEILFKAGVHPEQPGHTLDRAAWDAIWRHSVELLQRGFKTGSILTVDAEEAKVLGPPWTRRYIYNQAMCGRCGSKVSTWDMAARKVYACQTCQPLLPGTIITPARVKALAAATGTKLFISHCAPDDTTAVTPEKMTVAMLKKKLAALGLPARGKKLDLVAALTAALSTASAEGEPGVKLEDAEVADAAADLVTAPAKGAKKAARGKGRKVATAAATAKKETAAQKAAALRAAKAEEAEVSAEEEAALGPLTPQPKRPRRAPASPQIKQESSPVPEGSLDLSVNNMRQQLREGGLPSGGRREELWQRLQAAQLADTAASPAVRPGTAGLGHIATAKEAALEKQRAGENRAVEHVAQADEDILALEEKQPTRRKRNRRC